MPDQQIKISTDILGNHINKQDRALKIIKKGQQFQARLLYMFDKFSKLMMTNLLSLGRAAEAKLNDKM